MGPIRRWLDRVHAPEAVRAAVSFRELIARRDFRSATGPLEVLLTEARAGRHWVEPEQLREGAVITLLANGRAEDARKALTGLGSPSRPTENSLRTQLLEAYVARAEVQGGSTPEPPSP
jgi:hypothetical protein